MTKLQLLKLLDCAVHVLSVNIFSLKLYEAGRNDRQAGNISSLKMPISAGNHEKCMVLGHFCIVYWFANHLHFLNGIIKQWNATDMRKQMADSFLINFKSFSLEKHVTRNESLLRGRRRDLYVGCNWSWKELVGCKNPCQWHNRWLSLYPSTTSVTLLKSTI